MRLSPVAYRRVTVVAAVLVAVIIITGAAVRLTGSGLGCPSWPNCSPGRLTPQSATSYHAMVEFVNRTFTGAVSLGVIAAVLGALIRSPRRRDLTLLSLGLVAGVVGQIVLGGITVLTDLNPVAVMGHFVLSMIILADAVILVHRAGLPDGVPIGPVGRAVERRASVVQFVLTCAVVVTGTVVTNSGPHAGDRDAKRFDLRLTDIARVHSATTILLLAAIVVIVLVIGRGGFAPARRRALTWLLLVVVLQMAVGYTQYFTGVPALLVAVHILGAVLVFTASLHVLLVNRQPVSIPDEDPNATAERIGVGAAAGVDR
jgi:cytochrome c oxidase assembly protein subunit 15